MKRDFERRIDALESWAGNEDRPNRLVFCQHDETLAAAMARLGIPADANVGGLRWLAPSERS
jgi:hypothetical protein